SAMRSRSFVRASFGLSAPGVNFIHCVNFFCFMASPCGHVSRLQSRIMPDPCLSCCYLVDIVGPALERGAHLRFVLRTLIHTRHSGTMAGVVIEDGLDVVGLYA